MMSGRRIHDARPSITLSASSPPTPIAITPSASTCGVWLSVPTQVSGKATPSRAWTTGDIRSRLIWCMMPLPGGITSTFLNALLGPVDEVEAVFVAAVLDRAVLRERIAVEAAAFHRQRVVDDQLHRHHRIDLRRIAALLGDGIAQAGQVDQRGLAEDVVADHARREPREIEVALALDQLLQRVGERRRIAAAHQVFGQHARGVRQRGVGAGLDRLDRCAGVEIVQRGAGQGLAVMRCSWLAIR